MRTNGLRSRLQWVAWAGVLAVGLSVGGRADEPMLKVCEDESSMEQAIEQYLKEVHNFVVTEKHADPDNLWLRLPMQADPMPVFSIDLDTFPSNRDEQKQVIERMIRMVLHTGVQVPADKRASAVKVCNDFARGETFSAAYVDKDGEIVLDWTLNVMEQGLHPEYVYDLLVRMSNNWRKLGPQVDAALK